MANVSQVGGTPDDVFTSRAENAAILAEEAQAAAEAAQAAAEAALASTLAALAAQTLNDHADVSVPAPADNQVLTFDAGTGNWVAEDLPSGSSVADLSDLNDVSTAGVVDGDFLNYVAGSAEWQVVTPAASPFLLKTGGTLTGALVLPGAPTAPLQAATKAYVDTRFLTVNPYDLAVFYNGIPGADQDILRFVAGRDFYLPAGLTNSAAYAAVAATAAYDIDVRKNGVSVGTISWAIGANSATFTFASDVAFTGGDRLELIGQTTPDATLEDVFVTLAGIIGSP